MLSTSRASYVSILLLLVTVFQNVCIDLSYNRKYWQSIKFGSLAVGEATVNIKSVKFILLYRGEVQPNLNPPILLFEPLKTKPPNLKTTNISCYTVTSCPLPPLTTREDQESRLKVRDRLCEGESTNWTVAP